jgi:myo-inositol-1(or 4)-monophosphatase
VISVSGAKTLADSIVMTGLDKNAAPGARPYAFMEAIAMNSRKARIMGSAALDICFVAAGRADGYFEAGIYIWDVAAAGLIVRRSGGLAEQTGTTDDGRLHFMATNGKIHAELLGVINAAKSQAHA